MDTALFQLEAEHYGTRPQTRGPDTQSTLYSHPQPDPTPAERRRTKTKPRTLDWFAVQAVRLNNDRASEYYGQIELRSFPFWTLSLEAARRDLVEMAKTRDMPYTHIIEYGYLHQEARKHSQLKIKTKVMINIKTGEKR